MSRMILVGLVTNEGISCPALRTAEGELYTLAYSGEPMIRVGDMVRVTGVPAQASICMQGIAVQVESLEVLYRSGCTISRGFGKPGIFPIPRLPVDFSKAELVSKIIDVELDILKCLPPKLSISVKGLNYSTGWSFPHLVEHLYFVEPSDGMWDYSCLAMPPTGMVNMIPVPFSFSQVFDNMPQNLRGVRIHSQTKTPFIKMIDDAKKAIDPSFPDFNEWQGKRFVRSGQQNPGGDVVSEDTLKNLGIRYRVLGPGDVGDTMFDPRRLTVHLDENDIVIALSWG